MWEFFSYWEESYYFVEKNSVSTIMIGVGIFTAGGEF